MTHYKIQRSRTAEIGFADLLYFFWEVSENAELVDRIKEAILTAIDSLQTMPMRFASAGFTDKNIRKMRIARYPIIIYFEVVADTVIILHITHARSNHQANFSQIYQ